MAELLPQESYALIDAASQMEVERIQRIVASALATFKPVGRDAARLARGSAPVTSHLETVLRDRFAGPRYDELRAGGGGLGSLAASTIRAAALAILNAPKLSEEEFEALVGPLRAEGVPVPSHAELLARR
jgi:hypothetical protein